MFKFLKIVSVLALTVSLVSVSGVAYAGQSQAVKACRDAGFTYVKEVDTCMMILKDSTEIGKFMEANTPDDPKCVGKPVGFKYYTKVVDPIRGEGTAEHICGVRPN